MYDWLTRSANDHPDAPFLTTPAGTFAFGQFEAAVARRAGGLVDQGINGGDVVAVFASNTADALVDLFAVPRSGATLLLLNTRHTDAELNDQVARAGAVAVLGTRADLGVRSLARSDSAPLSAPSEPPEVHTIAFTSGSSGRPLGVRLTWENLEASAKGSAAHLRHRRDDRWLCVMPVFHVGGFMILLRSARAGSEVVLERRFDAARAAALLHEVSLASVVPTMLQHILEADPGPYRGLRALLVGGAGAPQSLLDRALTAGLPALSTYGMTETASQVATAPLGEPPRRRVMPIPGAELRITDDEIEVRGPMVSPGYVGQENRAADSWLPTGDLGEFDGEGLVVIGRKYDRIITGGENVDPLEIEIALADVPGVTEALVVGIPDPEWGQTVAALVAGPAAESTDAIEAALRIRLAGYKIPRRWLALPGVPRTSIGKPDRQAARALLQEGR